MAPPIPEPPAENSSRSTTSRHRLSTKEPATERICRTPCARRDRSIGRLPRRKAYLGRRHSRHQSQSRRHQGNGLGARFLFDIADSILHQAIKQSAPKDATLLVQALPWRNPDAIQVSFAERTSNAAFVPPNPADSVMAYRTGRFRIVSGTW